MYVCARTLVTENPGMALEIALWHLSLYNDRSLTSSSTYFNSQKFYKVKEIVEKNVYPVPIYHINTLEKLARTKFESYKVFLKFYNLEQVKLNSLQLNFTLMRNHFDTLNGTVYISTVSFELFLCSCTYINFLPGWSRAEFKPTN